MSGDEQLAANLIGAVAKERGGWDKQVEVVLAFMAEIRRLRAPRPDVEALLGPLLDLRKRVAEMEERGIARDRIYRDLQGQTVNALSDRDSLRRMVADLAGALEKVRSDVCEMAVWDQSEASARQDDAVKLIDAAMTPRVREIVAEVEAEK